MDDITGSTGLRTTFALYAEMLSGSIAMARFTMKAGYTNVKNAATDIK
jgi:hypothetical protein